MTKKMSPHLLKHRLPKMSGYPRHNNENHYFSYDVWWTVSIGDEFVRASTWTRRIRSGCPRNNDWYGYQTREQKAKTLKPKRYSLVLRVRHLWLRQKHSSSLIRTSIIAILYSDKYWRKYSMICCTEASRRDIFMSQLVSERPLFI